MSAALVVYSFLIIGAIGALPDLSHPVYFFVASIPVIAPPYFLRRFAAKDLAIYRLERAALRDDFDPEEHGGNMPYWMRGNHRIYGQAFRDIALTALCLVGGWAAIYLVVRFDP